MLQLLTRRNKNKLKINKELYVLKRITPFDFLHLENGVPFSMIKQKKIQTMYEKTVGEREKDVDSKKSFECIMQVLEQGVSHIEYGFLKLKHKKFDRKEFEKNTKQISIVFALYEKIIELSFIKFNRPIELHYNQASYYANLSDKLHVSPIEILFPLGNYSEMDAYIFNSYITFHSQKLETKNKKLNRARAKGTK